MLLDENNPQPGPDGQAAENNNDKPAGYRVDDDKGAAEKDLKRNPVFGAGEMQPPHEGQPMGGQNFNKDGNPTPTGDDKDNPSRYAGYSNAYFSRTKPAEEYTQYNNFKAAGQEGSPDYDKAQPNVPGPQEVPDQQKVGENNESEPGKAAGKPGHDKKPDDGSNGPSTEKEHIET